MELSEAKKGDFVLFEEDGVTYECEITRVRYVAGVFEVNTYFRKGNLLLIREYGRLLRPKHCTKHELPTRPETLWEVSEPRKNRKPHKKSIRFAHGSLPISHH